MRRELFSRLLHFFIIGFALYSVSATYDKHQQRYIDCLSESQLKVLTSDWTRSTGRAATPIELSHLAQVALDEKMLVKEAMLQGLHKSDSVINQRLLRDADFLGLEGSVKDKIDAVMTMNMPASDEVIRRRLIQLLQHNMTELEEGSYPSAAQLDQIYAESKELGLVAARFSFEHVFFDSDDGEAKARVALDAPVPNQGDVFLDGNYFSNMTLVSITSKFGEDFSLALVNTDTPVSDWFGPLESVYGFHLVRILQRHDSYRRSQADMAPVLADRWRRERQTQVWAAYIDKLRDKYQVVCHANT
ncbi:MAG: hypothetical protein ACI955_001586 [Zhongshania sp.]